MAANLLGALSRYSGAIGVGLIGLNTCLYNVDAGHRGVIFDNLNGGVLKDVKSEGTHFIMPIIQRPIIMEVRTKPKELPSITGTKDLQTVQIKLRVLWRPDVKYLPHIYQTLGADYEERVLPSIGNEVLKMVVAQYNASELLSKRAEVSNRIKDELIKRAKTFNLIFDDVAITHLHFGAEYMRAIEAKQVEQQEVERKSYIVDKARQLAQATVLRAEGEAKAAEIITDAIEKSGDGIIEVKRIDAAKDVADLLKKSRNVTYLPGGGGSKGGGMGMLLNIDK